MLEDLLLVCCGGGAGAVARYFVLSAAAHRFGGTFPFGTIIVNIGGSSLLGLLAESPILTSIFPIHIYPLLVVGFLGSFTTFSTFSLDVALLYERRQFAATALYVVGSVFLSVGGFFAALHLMRSLTGTSM